MGLVGNCDQGCCGVCGADEIDLDAFDVDQVTVNFQMKVVSSKGQALKLSYIDENAETIDECMDGLNAALFTLTGYFDSQS